MEKYNDFNLLKEEMFPTLLKFVPIVSRVHGKTHPQFYEVEKQFNIINTKLINKDYSLGSEFYAIREVTNNYEIPSDVCESYELVYNYLEKLDEAYFK